jgi:hypothetical protein
LLVFASPLLHFEKASIMTGDYNMGYSMIYSFFD